jgi:hypothetical protein
MAYLYLRTEGDISTLNFRTNYQAKRQYQIPGLPYLFLSTKGGTSTWTAVSEPGPQSAVSVSVVQKTISVVLLQHATPYLLCAQKSVSVSKQGRQYQSLCCRNSIRLLPLMLLTACLGVAS